MPGCDLAKDASEVPHALFSCILLLPPVCLVTDQPAQLPCPPFLSLLLSWLVDSVHKVDCGHVSRNMGDTLGLCVEVRVLTRHEKNMKYIKECALTLGNSSAVKRSAWSLDPQSRLASELD